MQIPISFLLVALGALAGFAQENVSQGNIAIEPLSTTNFSCWTSGSGSTYMRICVSRHGNITMFQSPSGKEHIRVGSLVEGYTVCVQPTLGDPFFHEYSDLGSSEAGWHEPYKVQQPGGANTLPLTIYRKSTDGSLELVQSFSRDAAERDLTVTMTIFNRSADTMYNLGIGRTVDFDASGTPGSDTFLRTDDSVIAWDNVDWKAVSLTSLNPVPVGGFGQFAWPKLMTYGNWSTHSGSSCDEDPDIEYASPPTAPGDYVGVVWQYWWGNADAFPAGASRTVKFLYRIE